MIKKNFVGLLITTFLLSPAYASDSLDSNSQAIMTLMCKDAVLAKAAEVNPVPNAAYQAGIDVNGQPVTPADIAATPVKLPDYIEVPMTIDLAKRMNLPQVGAEAEMPVANLKLYLNGKVEFNGQDITTNAAAVCGKPSKPVDEKKSDEISAAQNIPQSNVAQIEPAAGQDLMVTAPSITISAVQGTRDNSASPSPAISGSVMMTATSPESKIMPQTEGETVNRYAIDMDKLKNAVVNTPKEEEYDNEKQ